MVSVQSVKKVFVSFRACRGIPFYYCAFHGILRYAQHDRIGKAYHHGILRYAQHDRSSRAYHMGYFATLSMTEATEHITWDTSLRSA